MHLTGAVEPKSVGSKALHPSDFLPLFVLPALALLVRGNAADWIFMWAMACALFAGAKWLTFREARRRGLTCPLPRVAGYFLAWPGMEALEFFDEQKVSSKPRPSDWFSAAAKMVFGAFLLWVIARMVLPAHPIIAGWIGMTGAALVVHFGLFHALSLGWRQAGIEAQPIMQNPLASKSLAEFWGRRWNTAFKEIAYRFIFRPLCRLVRPGVASLLVFAISGLVHELVISLPARGGYGLPTAYFLLQGLGVTTERTPWGRRIGLGRGARGWLFTVLMTAGPALWLFNPRFITVVILPMLRAIGAT